MATPIYHITHVDNLARIVKTNGLWCDAERIRQGFPSIGIAHQRLKDRRASTAVKRRSGQTVAAGGTLADYVPFYFANRSPMLFSIHTGHVKGYDGSQTGIVYLVTSMERIAASGRLWCFTNGHAVEAITDYFESVAELNQVDWSVIRNWSWKNTDADSDRKRRKQAEFLVQQSVPWPWIEQIGVCNSSMKRTTESVLAGANATHRPAVVVEPKWYY